MPKKDTRGEVMNLEPRQRPDMTDEAAVLEYVEWLEKLVALLGDELAANRAGEALGVIYTDTWAIYINNANQEKQVKFCPTARSYVGPIEAWEMLKLALQAMRWDGVHVTQNVFKPGVNAPAQQDNGKEGEQYIDDQIPT